MAAAERVLAVGRPGPAVTASLGIVSAVGGEWRTWQGGAIDHFIHSELLFVKLPILFLNVRMKRMTEWPDAGEVAERGGVHGLLGCGERERWPVRVAHGDVGRHLHLLRHHRSLPVHQIIPSRPLQ